MFTETSGAIHSTKISGRNFRDYVLAIGPGLRAGLVPFPSQDKYRAHFQNGRWWIFVSLF